MSMTNFRRCVFAAMVASLLGGALMFYALAQPAGGVVNLPDPLTGNEIVSVLPIQGNGQPGAVIANVTMKQIANFIANNTVSTVTSGAVTMTTPTLILTAALTGPLTVALPAAPVDGEIVVFSNQSGAAFTQPITVPGAAGGPITAVTVTAPGTGYTTAMASITTTTGSGAVLTPVIASGAISAVTVTMPGTGYAPTDTVTITGDGTGATATLAVTIASTIIPNMPQNGSARFRWSAITMTWTRIA